VNVSDQPWNAILQPYYQPAPASPVPFSISSKFHDPKPYNDTQASAWAINVKDSKDILIYGIFLPPVRANLEWHSLLRCRVVQLFRCKFKYDLFDLRKRDDLFFQNYTQSCIATRNCQAEIFNIDTQSDISIYSLTTVATTYQLTVGKHGVIDQKDNVDGFASTATVWTRKWSPAKVVVLTRARFYTFHFVLHDLVPKLPNRYLSERHVRLLYTHWMVDLYHLLSRTSQVPLRQLAWVRTIWLY